MWKESPKLGVSRKHRQDNREMELKVELGLEFDLG